MIKTQKSHHMTKFFVTCNNPRIASTKTQSIFCNKTSFAKTRFRKDEHLMISKSRYLSFLKQKSVSKLQTFENNPKVMKFQENCQERGDRSLISSPLSSQKFEQNFLKLKAFFDRFLHLIFETNISFQNSNTQISFL